MQLIGKLKNKVDQAANKEEAREIIEQAGMKLSDEELEMVSGGISGEDVIAVFKINLNKIVY